MSMCVKLYVQRSRYVMQSLASEQGYVVCAGVQVCRCDMKSLSSNLVQ